MNEAPNAQAKDMRFLCGWTHQALDLLAAMENGLQSNAKAWNEFEQDGQRGFFEEGIMAPHLEHIRSEYRRMQWYLQDVTKLKGRCEQYLDNVSYSQIGFISRCSFSCI
jgi:hypothetical protein